MRTSVTFLMAGVLLGQHVFNLAQVVHYALEYDHHVNVLCENRDRPELRCIGCFPFEFMPAYGNQGSRNKSSTEHSNVFEIFNASTVEGT